MVSDGPRGRLRRSGGSRSVGMFPRTEDAETLRCPPAGVGRLGSLPIADQLGPPIGLVNVMGDMAGTGGSVSWTTGGELDDETVRRRVFESDDRLISPDRPENV